MKTRALSMVITAAALALPLAASAEPGNFFVTPFIGYQYFDSDTHVKDSGLYGVGGEYQFTDSLGAEIDYARSLNAELKKSAGGNDVDVDRLSLDGIYYLSNWGNLQPYLKAGVGHVRNDVKHAGTDENTDVDAGVGVRWSFAQNWSARAEAKALHELDNSYTHGLFTLGVSYAFGGAKPAPAAPAPVLAPKAAPAPVAPLDSDGDGVTDDKDKCPNTPRGRQVDENGCEFVLRKTEEIRLDINFATDKADITDAYIGEVEKAAKFLKKYGNVNATIEGHTDASGSHAHNQKLSQRRADAVRDALIKRFGIESSRLNAVGYAETKPIASNKTKEGRAQNRRVVAVFKAEVVENPNR